MAEQTLLHMPSIAGCCAAAPGLRELAISTLAPVHMDAYFNTLTQRTPMLTQLILALYEPLVLDRVVPRGDGAADSGPEGGGHALTCAGHTLGLVLRQSKSSGSGWRTQRSIMLRAAWFAEFLGCCSW